MEKYQGIIFVNGTMGYDHVLYTPIQEEEFRNYVTQGKLPDGRIIDEHIWLDQAVREEGIFMILLSLLHEEFGLPSELLEEITSEDLSELYKDIR